MIFGAIVCVRAQRHLARRSVFLSRPQYASLIELGFARLENR